MPLPALPTLMPQQPQPVTSFLDTIRGNDAAIEILVGQGRLLTLKTDIAGAPKENGEAGGSPPAPNTIATPKGRAVIAVGDEKVVDFQILPNPRMIRLIGKRAGVTDLSVVGADGQAYGFQIRVVYDLEMLRAHLRQAFPDAYLRIGQLGDQVIVEGQARTPAQVAEILTTIRRFIKPVPAREGEPEDEPAAPALGGSVNPGAGNQENAGYSYSYSSSTRTTSSSRQSRPDDEEKHPFGLRIINLLRVPGVHQVMLQVRMAELNRTATRQIGADLLGVDPSSGTVFGSSLGNGTVSALGLLGLGGVAGTATGATGPKTTAFGVFPTGNFEILINALRKNRLLSIMAEPNLMAMNGHSASFLAGGQFPVPVPQSSSGLSSTTTIEWKNFGVQLNFVPYVLEDESIRLIVAPEVSTLDFALGTTLVVGGSPVPGLNTRKAATTVELREGQTLAIAGLLSVTIDGQTSRIPGLGDLPYIGPLFSNTSHERQEKELLVLVTPHLVAPMNPGQVPALPGADLKDPTDCEFYLKNHIEGQKDPEYRSTANWDASLRCKRAIRLEKNCVSGPVGFSQ